MKSKLSIILFVTFLFASTKVFATVDYLTVNHVTKQLYWAETDQPSGWIGWTTIPEGQWEIEQKKYLETGYSFTSNPYFIEEVIASLIILSILVFWIIMNYKKRKCQ
tara:strand:- start:15 stop:335 length:321 start_codon:yes stop_codon:yes gene_type:complete